MQLMLKNENEHSFAHTSSTKQIGEAIE